VEFRFTPEQQAFGAQARDFFAEHVTEDLLAGLERDQEEHSASFHERLAAKGWIGLQWPEERGGAGLTDIEAAMLMEAAGYYGAPMTGYLVAVIGGSTILTVGSEEQISRWLPGIARGEVIVALGYSEPEAGSDLASLGTRAIPTPDGWVLRGTKIFTSLAHHAGVALVAARTDPEARKHRGLTVFVVPMDRAGIGVAPIHTLGGFRTNTMSLDDVAVRPGDVLGEVGEGWATLGAALDLERTGASRLGLCRKLLDTIERELGPGGLTGAHEHMLWEFERRLAATRLLSYRAAWIVTQGKLPTAEAAMAKVASTELAQDIASAAISAVGSRALVGRDGGGPDGGLLERSYRNAARFTITAGTSEIQRTIIALAHLKLPRSA
jgi:alkylation response protein AidB-like acyl-CoA dehydrogenase